MLLKLLTRSLALGGLLSAQYASTVNASPIRTSKLGSGRRNNPPTTVAGVGPANLALPQEIALAPLVNNALGRDEDPSPLTYITSTGEQAYFIPTIDFGSNIFFHNNTDLNKLYTVPSTVLYTFPSVIGTEAADVMQWDANTYLITVSALSDGTMRAVTFSLSGLINGTSSSNPVDHGTITDTNGNKLYGYDSHVFKHPNGNIYLVYSNNVSLRIARMTSYNTVTGDTLLVQTNPTAANKLFYNTEAPSTVIIPDITTGNSVINLAFATGAFLASDYNTRLMYISSTQDPLVSSNWFLVTQPFLQSSTVDNAYAPGSGGFFTGPDGTNWFAYGGYDRPECQGNDNYPRTIRVQKAPSSLNGLLLPNTPIYTPQSTLNLNSILDPSAIPVPAIISSNKPWVLGGSIPLSIPNVSV